MSCGRSGRRGKRGSEYDGRSQGYMTEGSRASYRGDRRSHVNDSLGLEENYCG